MGLTETLRPFMDWLLIVRKIQFEHYKTAVNFCLSLLTDGSALPPDLFVPQAVI